MAKPDWEVIESAYQAGLMSLRVRYLIMILLTSESSSV
ncbi:Uncharacterised protein [Yersinia enterocolitica]|nr:Uncharacterised protein [Yersinia enterocolitica]